MTDADTETPNPERTPYAIVGGEAVVRKLVDTFYDQMDEDPDFFGIRKLHPPSLATSREKLYMFLTGWLGGPPLYTAEFGHPRLRARHLPFAIGEAERDQWMTCMTQAMEVVGIRPEMRAQLEASFANTADWMRNKDG
ncbi:MAG: group II truncated hemoglobin [Betaproteobacteria bacterium]|jgi:hemoglobin